MGPHASHRPSVPGLLVLSLLLAGPGCYEKEGPVLGEPWSPPLPESVAPVPSPAQLAWQTQELGAMFHFGINTFADVEHGDGRASPTLFNPTMLDAQQWISAIRNAGLRHAVLTVKHHDGFCLWRTACATYSVANSPFQGGQGDVVRQFVDAAHEGNVRVGLALSPFDANDPTYGTPAYESVFQCELTELLSQYGPIDQMWFWTDPVAPPFDRAAMTDFVHRLQPQTLVLWNGPSARPLSRADDVRSADYAGLVSAPTPMDESSIQEPADSNGSASWIPVEAVYSTRPNWFWHAADDARVKNVEELLDLYFDTVGRNTLLRLNVPPDTRGLLADEDVTLLNQLGPAIQALYRTNVAAGRVATADSVFNDLPTYSAASAFDGRGDTFWAATAGATSARLEVDLGGARSFDIISIQEPIALGERTTQHHLEARMNGEWTTVATGTSIGERRLYRLTPLTADAAALVITAARAAPAISELGLYSTANAQ